MFLAVKNRSIYLAIRPKHDYTLVHFTCKCGCDSICMSAILGESGLICKYVCLGCREEQIVPFSGVEEFTCYLVYVYKGKVVKWRLLKVTDER
jgi:hypothetical protein